jgi:gamma-glutamylcyclotransferase (GGCT)/AIG2-like uncharacterized protein YtfP
VGLREDTSVAALLFAYGTLMPTDPDRGAGQGWRPDAVRGRLFDLGPYPALVDLDDPRADWVAGLVKPVEPAELERHDEWEDVSAGLYRRILTTSRNNDRVWVYVYARPLPPLAHGPIQCWQSRS